MLWLKRLFASDWEAEIKELNDKLGYCELGQSQRDADIANKDRNITELADRIDQQIKEIEVLTNEPATERPTWMVEGTVYKGRRTVNFVTKERLTVEPEDLYIVTPSIHNAVKDILMLDFDKQIKSIWAKVISWVTYRYDEDEEWLFPQETLRLCKGDCEDGTILFVSMCRAAGIPSDRVFNVCGKYNDIGHSFPIVQMSDGKWYVFETTLDSIPSSPKLFLGSSYNGNLGCANWQHVGRLPKYDGVYQI